MLVEFEERWTQLVREALSGMKDWRVPCPTCGVGFFPWISNWDCGPRRNLPPGWKRAWRVLGTWMPFRPVGRELAFFTGVL